MFRGTRSSSKVVPTDEPTAQPGGSPDSIVKSLSQVKRQSLIDGSTSKSCPSLQTKNGSLASSFYAPHPRPGSGVCLSPNGEFLLRYGFSSEIKLIKASTAALVNTLRGSTAPVGFATFSSDGKFVIAASDDCRLLVFNMQKATAGTPCLVNNIDVGMEPLLYCLMSPDNDVVLSCDDDGQLELWGLKCDSMIRRFEPGQPSKVANFALEGSAVISCSDGDLGVVLLNTSTGKILSNEEFNDLGEGRNKPAYTISSGGKLVLVFTMEPTTGNNLAVYNTETQEYKSFRACNGSILHAEFSASGDRFIAAGRDDLIHVYDSVEGILGVLEGHDSDVMFCRMSADQRFAISGDNTGCVLVWDVAEFGLILRLQAHKHPVLHCDLSADGKRAYSLDSVGQAYLWYLDSQGIFDIMGVESDKLCSCSATLDNTHMALGYADGMLRYWKMGLQVDMVWEHDSHSTPVVSVGVSPKAGLIVSASRDGNLVFTSQSDGVVLAVVPGVHNDVVTDIEFGYQTMLTSARDSTLKVWRGIDKSTSRDWLTNPPKPSTTLVASSEVISCALTNDGKMAVATCSGGDVISWNTHDGSLRFSKLVSAVPLTSIEFSDSGSFLLIGSQDGSTAVFDINGNMLRSLVANASGINFAYFDEGGPKDNDLSGSSVVSVCALQAVTWDLAGRGSKTHSADFIADQNKLFRVKSVQQRTFVAHDSVALYDAKLSAAIYDMRTYEKHPGDSYMFRHGTALLRCGVHNKPLVMYSPARKPINMLMDETGGGKAQDFSSDGHLLVSGNTRGELAVWDVENHQHMKTWMAHKRSAITCVKFSHDSLNVYSCGEDSKVILWDWRSTSQLAILSGHQTAVVSVEMSLDGSAMVSGDRDGIIIIWDTLSQVPQRTIAVHHGAVLGCTISPDGRLVASSGVDEHISIRDAVTGEEVLTLDDALDGKGLTIKFSFDGTRLQVGGEKGNILVWDVAEDCLIFEIQAHEGKVFDCSWSGDSRQLLSAGADGRVRLWDAAAGSELCEADFTEGFGDIDTGGFITCDISSNGAVMAGCTAKGHLIQWDIHKELRRVPNGNILYKWLASLPVAEARRMYHSLLGHMPLVMNAQDSQGWTVLMHAVANSNPEITKIIVGSVKPKSGILGLVASRLRNSPGISPGQSSHFVQVAIGEGIEFSPSPIGELSLPAAVMVEEEGSSIRRSFLAEGEGGSSVQHKINSELSTTKLQSHPSDAVSAFERESDSVRGSCESRVSRLSRTSRLSINDRGSKTTGATTNGFKHEFLRRSLKYLKSSHKASNNNMDEEIGPTGDPQEGGNFEPNAIEIAIRSGTADCVSLLLDAVLKEKVTVGSYAAVTASFHSVVQLYPEMSSTFLCGLPLLTLGEMEIPASVAAQGTVVWASTSYTSFKEMWYDALELGSIPKGPMVMMQASMVKLPYAASLGTDTILSTLIDTSRVPVKAFGSESVKAIINYKWNKFAKRIIFTKALVYLVFIAIFTIYAIMRSDENPDHSLKEMWSSSKGVVRTSLSVMIFLFGLYYLALEMHQMFKLGLASYFASFWNFLDLASYSICLMIAPCELLRIGVAYESFMWPLVSVECLMLWVKAGFFGLAVDGLGTFIYMTVEIVKGMRYFMLLLFIIWLMFAVAFMNLFPVSYLYSAGAPADDGIDLSGDALWSNYRSFGRALMTSYMTTYNALDPATALNTRHPEIAIILICVFDFLVVLLFTNMLITLMSEVYERIRDMQHFVFLENRAHLVIEVESTMTDNQLESNKVPPFLHLLTPIKAVQDDGADADATATETADQRTARVVATILRQMADTGELAACCQAKPPLDDDCEGGSEYGDADAPLTPASQSRLKGYPASRVGLELSEGGVGGHVKGGRVLTAGPSIRNRPFVLLPSSEVRGSPRGRETLPVQPPVHGTGAQRRTGLKTVEERLSLARLPAGNYRTFVVPPRPTALPRGGIDRTERSSTGGQRGAGSVTRLTLQSHTSKQMDVGKALSCLTEQLAGLNEKVTLAMSNGSASSSGNARSNGVAASLVLEELVNESTRKLEELKIALEGGACASAGAGGGMAGSGGGAGAGDGYGDGAGGWLAGKGAGADRVRGATAPVAAGKGDDAEGGMGSTEQRRRVQIQIGDPRGATPQGSIPHMPPAGARSGATLD